MDKLNNIERIIVEIIKVIREKKRSKPTSELLFNTLNKHGELICIEEFKDGVRQLEASHIIFTLDKDGDSYYINYENGIYYFK